MFWIVTRRHALHHLAGEFASSLESLAAHRLLPLRGTLHYCVSNFIARFRIGVPNTAGQKRGAMFKVEIEPGRWYLFPGDMREARRRHCLIRIRVGSKTQVPINAQ